MLSHCAQSHCTGQRAYSPKGSSRAQQHSIVTVPVPKISEQAAGPGEGVTPLMFTPAAGVLAGLQWLRE